MKNKFCIEFAFKVVLEMAAPIRDPELSPEYFQQFENVSRSNRLPTSLDYLLHSLYQDQIRDSSEFLIAIIYYLFLETGFTPVALPDELNTKIRTHWGFSFVAQIPEHSWNLVADEIIQQYMQLYGKANECESTVSNVPKSEEIYKFTLKLFGHSECVLQLIVRKIFDGSSICVTCCLEQYKQSTSIVLRVNDFINITENIEFERIRQNPNKYFLKFQLLNTEIKQTLIAGLRNVIMYECAYANAALNGLPKELLWILLKYLRSDLIALQNMSQTCVYLRNMIIMFLNESNIRLKHRQPTPITYDSTNELQLRSRRRIYNVYPWIFHPFNF